MPVVEDDNATDMSNESGFDPMRSFTEGSFLQFGRAVLGPTALNQKVTIGNFTPTLLGIDSETLNWTNFRVDSYSRSHRLSGFR